MALLLAAVPMVRAQEYNAFALGAEMLFEQQGMPLEQSGFARYYFTGPVKHGDKEYLEMRCQYLEGECVQIDSVWRGIPTDKVYADELKGLIRSENGKIYYLKGSKNYPLVPDSTYTEGLIYDFNLQPGDTCQIMSLYGGQNMEIRCAERGVSIIQDVEADILTIHLVNSDYDEQEMYWFIGFGAPWGPTWNIYAGAGGGTIVLRKVTIDDKVVFENNVAKLYYPPEREAIMKKWQEYRQAHPDQFPD